jgi:hypothetical protein
MTVSGISTGGAVLSMPGVAAVGAAGAVTDGDADTDGAVAAPARVPAVDEVPSPPPHPASMTAAATEMQCNWVLNGKRIFSTLSWMCFVHVLMTNFFFLLSRKGNVRACELIPARGYK